MNYINILPLFSDWSLFLLRVVFGVVLIAHGWLKVRNLPGTIQWFGSEGFRPGWFWARAILALELVGGVAIIVGIFVQIFVALFTAQFIVLLVWRQVRRAPFVGGFELELLLLAVALVLLTAGGGAIFTLSGYLFGY